MSTQSYNFPLLLRDFLLAEGQAGNWAQTVPPWDKIKWAYRASDNFLRDSGRRGSNWIWADYRTMEPRAHTERFMTGWTYVDVFCFASALSDKESDSLDAQTRCMNMMRQVSDLVHANATKISPAWIARPATGGRPMNEKSVDPPFWCVVLPIGFWHKI